MTVKWPQRTKVIAGRPTPPLGVGIQLGRVRVYVPVVIGVFSLVAGGVVGFFIASASRDLEKELFEIPDIARPRNLVRKRFQLQYPSNWKVDVDDEDYDPDHMFRIKSPGSAYVMFVINNAETKPEDLLQNQISAFEKLFEYPTISNHERYGQLSGSGAILRGKFAAEHVGEHGGLQATIEIFCFSENYMTVRIVEYYLDDTSEYIQDGLTLIENSFFLIADYE